MMKWKWCGGSGCGLILGTNPLGGMRKTMKYVRQDCLCAGQDFNRAPPRYKTEVLTISVNFRAYKMIMYGEGIKISKEANMVYFKVPS
jgi:hypothetical protein